MNTTSSTIDTIAGLTVGLVVYALYAVAYWRIFVKSGRAGWLALIPIVNTVVFIKIGGRSGWFALLYLIPIVNLVVHYLVGLWVARSFGHGHGYAIGLFLLPLVFAYVLAFGGSTYVLTPGRSHNSSHSRLATA